MSQSASAKQPSSLNALAPEPGVELMALRREAAAGDAALLFPEPPRLSGLTSAGLAHEPACDLSARCQRNKEARVRIGSFRPRDWGVSLAGHVMAVALVLGIGAVFRMDRMLISESEPIEVTFGLGDLAGAVKRLNTTPGDTDSDPEALKSAQQLPQISKNAVLEAPSAANANELPLPEAPKVMATAKNQVTNTPNAAALDAPTPPPGAKILTPEEMARRLERETRKVGEKEREGARLKPGEGAKTEAIPAAPKALLEGGLPNMPVALMAGGDPSGRANASVASAYGQAARSHVRKWWNIPDVARFDPGIEVIVTFTVDVLGRVSRIKVAKASAEPAFDEVALKAIQEANPFPDLPKELSPRQAMRMRFSPKEIK